MEVWVVGEKIVEGLVAEEGLFKYGDEVPCDPPGNEEKLFREKLSDETKEEENV